MASDPTEADRESSERSGTRLKSWFLLNGPRQVVAGVIAAGLFTFVLAVSVVRLGPGSGFQPLFYVFSGLISGNLTIITVVVSINQLLLSREISTPPELQSEIDGIVEYRQEIEDYAGQVAPVEPLGFHRLLLETTRQQAQKIGGLSIGGTGRDVSEEIDEVVSKITQHADHIDGLLDERDVGTFQVLSTSLNTNYAHDINTLREIQSRHAADIPTEVSESIDDLIRLLQDIDIARQYLKSIYLQQELASLSRLLFYTGLPSIAVVAAALFLFVTPNGTGLPTALLEVLIPAAITIGLLPLIVLFSFILRSATVARRTAAVTPFTTPAQEN